SCFFSELLCGPFVLFASSWFILVRFYREGAKYAKESRRFYWLRLRSRDSSCLLVRAPLQSNALLCLKALRRLLAQLPRARLRRTVPLRRCQHRVTHHESSDRCGPTPRRIE